jgi:hypothetical protein
MEPRTASASPPDNDLDPRLLEDLRAALAVLAGERRTAAGLVGGPPKPGRPAEVRGRWWHYGLVLAVSGVAVVGVLAYTRLAADFRAIKRDLGQMRTELAPLNKRQVRKADFDRRNLAAQALLWEVGANNKAAVETSADRDQEQKQALAELRASLQDLRRERGRLGERIAAQRKRLGIKHAAPSTGGDGNGP